MRVLVQRVRRARVTVAEETTGEIGRGFLLVGVTLDDTAVAADLLARKVAHLRVFDDADGNLNRSRSTCWRRRADRDARRLAVHPLRRLPQRTPSQLRAGSAPAIAEPLVDRFADGLRALGLPVATGRFGAEMQVELVNDGPVTIWLDTAEL